MFDRLHKFSYLSGIINAFQQQVEFIRIPITFSSSCDWSCLKFCMTLTLQFKSDNITNLPFLEMN